MTGSVVEDAPLPLPPISEKERKYDRQLRLWAASGQAALESAHILLLNSGAGTVGIEMLKNLVLPGIGNFTIVDPAIVNEIDLGVNFFLDKASIGRSRAECCTELLLELNPEVKGDWFPKDEKDIFELKSVLYPGSSFSAVVYTLPISPQDLHLVEDYGRTKNIPVISMRSVGYYSFFQLHLPEGFPVVETHPDQTAINDLRLVSPWEDLITFSRHISQGLENMDNHEHGHVPFVVILLYFLDIWKSDHGGLYPSSYAEKIAFRQTISDAIRRDTPEGGEENFDEAVAAVLKMVVTPSIPTSLREVFEYSEERSGKYLSFWTIATAIEKFHQKHGQLPVPGNIPDMKAQSNVYIELQNIYKNKARHDVSEVMEIVGTLPGGETITLPEVELFCKNAAFVKVITPSKMNAQSLGDAMDREFGNDEVAAASGMPLSLFPIYLSLTAIPHATPSDEEELLSAIGGLARGATANERVVQAASEVIRAAGGELHNISAVVGGMVAQELIKVITCQYIPIDNTCVFDGIASRCQVLRL